MRARRYQAELDALPDADQALSDLSEFLGFGPLPPRPPRTRAGCSSLPRPCPCWGCRHSLAALTVDGATYPSGSSCVLDYCDEHPEGSTLAEVGALIATTGRAGVRIGVTRELVRLIEESALEKIRAACSPEEIRELLRDVSSLEPQRFIWPESFDNETQVAADCDLEFDIVVTAC